MERISSQERYQRQVILTGFGDAAQHALLRAKLLVVGAGGLGCPVLQYLTAAGAGCIGIVDDDVVAMSNLHRQVLYDTNDLGKPKVSVSAAKLRAMNTDTELTAYQDRLDKNNCLEIINGYDIIIDCTDNFESRYMINDACVLKNKPLVYAAVSGFEGQVAVFNVSREGKQKTGNYRDLFPEQPGKGEVMNCAEGGVLGVLPGIIGSLQASETIKLVTGVGEPLLNQLLTYNTMNNQFVIFDYQHDERSTLIMPRNESDFYKMNYEADCTVESRQFEIDAEKFDEMLLKKELTIIDVREPGELPVVSEFENTKIPLGELKRSMDQLAENNAIFFCQSGIRSQQAAVMAAAYFGNARQFYSLQEGIIAWKKRHEKQWT